MRELSLNGRHVTPIPIKCYETLFIPTTPLFRPPPLNRRTKIEAHNITRGDDKK